MAPRHKHAHAFVRSALFENLSSFSELESRISQLPTENARGNAFEVFAEAYLVTQKIIQAAEVWPERSVPLNVLKTFALPLKDLGADGVFQDRTGKLSAYQVKFRTGRVSLTWEELGTFMGLTDQVDERVLFTNSNDLPEVMNERSRFYCIRGADLDRLSSVDLGAICDWLRSGEFAVARKTPLLHQQEAIRKIITGLKKHDRVTAVMACGTGKTLIALWVAEQTQCRRVVVLLPSLALLRQTLHEWLKETQWPSMRFICVCSDSTVAAGTDDLIVRQSDLDFPVTTDRDAVRTFLADDRGDVQVVFTTYQSSRVVGDAAKGLRGFDLGIFDEAHKTAGREGTAFAFALTDRNLGIAKRVFLTATPRHYDIARRNRDGEAQEVFSMDVPAVYGPRVYTLPFAEAARRDIICDYKVIISVVTSEMVNDELLRTGEVVIEGDVVRARQVANQIALQKACEEHDLRKVFTFHTRVETARQFTGEGSQSIAVYLPNYRTLHVSGDMPTARREMYMKTFKEAERALISNARCLTEGVDVPAVDMVAFMSPKKSKVDIVQATGRAMRKARDKMFGYVMVPLFLEIAQGEMIEDALLRGDFGEIWNVLQAMREQDSALDDLIRHLTIEKGRTGVLDSNRTSERLEVLGPKLTLDQLRSSIALAIVEHLGTSWDQRYGEIQRFKQEHGHCNVPQGWRDPPRLGVWVAVQRRTKASGKLSPERIRRLEELGFDWSVFSELWEAGFAELSAYRLEYGDCNVPANWAPNPHLGHWVLNQRGARRKGNLPAERIKRLDDLGFDWDPLTNTWEKMFTALECYKRDNGDCNVSSRSHNDPALAVWVHRQRALETQKRLDAGRVERLTALGFDWDPLATAWDAMFADLRQYQTQQGHCDVPAEWPSNRALGRWVSMQRRLKNGKKLDPKRVKQLDDLGFEWDPLAAAWESMFTELKKYKVVHGDCSVPVNWTNNPQLGSWVGNVRRAKAKGTLEPVRVQRLEELGFEWAVNVTAWEKKFTDLRRYREKYGDCVVPEAWAENPSLSVWVSHQRDARSKGNLEPERVARLDEIGFEWRPLVTGWETMLTELKRYKEKYGDCNVPQHWAANPRLAKWAHRQRVKKKEGLPPIRVRQLEELGFEWDPLGATWNSMFRKLEQYKKQRGDCNVPHRWEGSPELGIWVTRQRTLKRKRQLEPTRVKRLEGIGFEWDPLAAAWERMFEGLTEYKKNYGDCNVPNRWKENSDLGKWVGLQRKLKKASKLGTERSRRLERLGFDWDPLSTTWDAMFDALSQYKRDFGHCNVPENWPQNRQLATWVSNLRRRETKIRTDSHRIRRLVALGFRWAAPKTSRKSKPRKSGMRAELEET